MRCVSTLISAIPVSGYTGTNCMSDINECADVNCNNGRCVDEFNSFQCNCDRGYTGTFCETLLDGYELQVTIYSFINPGDRCSGINSIYDCSQCCDNPCNTMGCHYFFSYCLRPAGSQVSYARTEYQGNCASINTTAEEDNPIREGLHKFSV